MTIHLEQQALPSNIADGVRDADDRKNAASLRVWAQSTLHVAPGLEIKRNVIDPSGGAQYTGGSSWTPGMPLISSSSGLSESCVFVPLTPDQRYMESLHGFGGASYETRPMTNEAMKRPPARRSPRAKVRFPKREQSVLAGLAAGNMASSPWLWGSAALAGLLGLYVLAKH